MWDDWGGQGHRGRRLEEVTEPRLGAPSGCGYKIVKTDTNVDTNLFYSTFLFPGLKICVRIRNNFYHWFLGHVITHCTPVPITCTGNDVKYYTGQYNIVGWGGSKKNNNL